MEGSRINADMIAPCGLDCSGCGRQYGALVFQMKEDTHMPAEPAQKSCPEI